MSSSVDGVDDADHSDETTDDRLLPQSPTEFCEAALPALVRMLTLRVGNRWVAEDLAQETLARALANWDKVQSAKNPSNYVYRIAVRLAASSLRRYRSERRALKQARAEAFGHIDQLELPLQSELIGLLRTLSRREREVLALRYGADLTVQATAEALGVTEGTVKTLSHRGLEKLRSELQSGRIE